MVEYHRVNTNDLHVVLLSKCEAPRNGVSGYHSSHKGVTALIWILFPYFKVGKFIAVHSDNDSKHLISRNPNNMQCHC